MKLKFFILAFACVSLAGCFGRARAPDVVLVDPSSTEVIAWLNSQGYPNSLITGLREDCGNISRGYGVLVKVKGPKGPTAASGVVCQDPNGEFTLILDQETNIVRK